MTWICHDCGYETENRAEAILHAEAARTHWLYLHDYSRYDPPTQEMHASDWEGVYVTPVGDEDAARLVRAFRER